jgi:ABC-type lipopolysaccharide export system ATPase subunit
MELNISSVTKRYGPKTALKDFDAVLTQGVYGILGPNRGRPSRRRFNNTNNPIIQTDLTFGKMTITGHLAELGVI